MAKGEQAEIAVISRLLPARAADRGRVAAQGEQDGTTGDLPRSKGLLEALKHRGWRYLSPPGQKGRG